MSMKVTVSELRKRLPPDILDQAVKDDLPCMIERGGETYAVIVSARQWRRHTIGRRLDALSAQNTNSPKRSRRVRMNC
jgi:PHD/YefM family antitoxin component YafN of YafNO toxin-antitoxin module